jgi:hypothetical protein
MRQMTVSPLLRLALRLDAALSASAGALTLATQSMLQTLLGMSDSHVLALGLFMLGYGLLLAWLGVRQALPGTLVWSLVIGNLLWVLGSVALTFSGWIEPTPVGVALLLAQAALVAVITELQYLGARRSNPPLAAA